VEVFTQSGHYNAAGSVRMTWLDVGAQSGVVGISLGSQAVSGLDLEQQVSVLKHQSIAHFIAWLDQDHALQQQSGLLPPHGHAASIFHMALNCLLDST
jgi:hypothetical protein